MGMMFIHGYLPDITIELDKILFYSLGGAAVFNTKCALCRHGNLQVFAAIFNTKAAAAIFCGALVALLRTPATVVFQHPTCSSKTN